jgi:hypothetical protein
MAGLSTENNDQEIFTKINVFMMPVEGIPVNPIPGQSMGTRFLYRSN